MGLGLGFGLGLGLGRGLGLANPNRNPNPNQDTDPLATVKRRILTAGNLSAPYPLSVRALRSDSDLLVRG